MKATYVLAAMILILILNAAAADKEAICEEKPGLEFFCA